MAPSRETDTFAARAGARRPHRSRPMKTRTYCLLALATLGLGCDRTDITSPDPATQPAAPSVAQGTIAQETVIDFHSPKTHAGPGAHPTVESTQYSFFNGGIRWAAGASVE